MTTPYFNSPGAILAVAFPPQAGLQGACTTLADLCRADYARPRFLSGRLEAARLIIARNLAAFIPGHGNGAARRAAAIETAAWHDLHAPGLTEADVDALAARYAEEQGARRLFPHATSFHD